MTLTQEQLSTMTPAQVAAHYQAVAASQPDPLIAELDSEATRTAAIGTREPEFPKREFSSLCLLGQLVRGPWREQTGYIAEFFVVSSSDPGQVQGARYCVAYFLGGAVNAKSLPYSRKEFRSLIAASEGVTESESYYCANRIGELVSRDETQVTEAPIYINVTRVRKPNKVEGGEDYFNFRYALHTPCKSTP